MSLVGNLEDLSLGDILQIISLSQKSGVLALAGDLGSGRIVFREGMVQAACLKGGPNSLREVLSSAGIIDPAGFDASVSRGEAQGVPIEEILESEFGVEAERIEVLVREATEGAIFEMFSWAAGDFSFDVRNELDSEDPQLVLANGVNAQYLAMEGLRLRDEQGRAEDAGGAAQLESLDGSDPVAGPPVDEPHEMPLFGEDSLETDTNPGFYAIPPAEEEMASGVVAEIAEPLELELLDEVESDGIETGTRLEAVLVDEEVPLAEEKNEQGPDTDSARDTLVARILERVDADPAVEDSRSPSATREPIGDEASRSVDTSSTPRDQGDLESDSSAASELDEESAPLADVKSMPVVLIDPDVIALEWIKGAIEEDFARVHVFQQAEQGLSRIRQYLIRGETPLVLISAATQIDPLSGIHGLGDFVKRLKAQAPRLVVLGLREDEDVAPVAMPASLDGVLRRPPRSQISEEDESEDPVARQVLSRALSEILAGQGETPSSPAPAAPSLQALREATANLQEASSKGEILPVVLDFASESFARVAIFIVREDSVFAIAGRGIAALEVDPLDSAPPISLSARAPGWVERVLESGKPITAAPETDADRALIDCLGGDVPDSAYLGPIESGSSVIAVLYGDQAPGAEPIPDTSALEVVLQHAGLALDRAALERALWEADAGPE